jgi:DNA invertase Pin-like site-specific DNA recombinase
MRRLLADVAAGAGRLEGILVFDVSRWGRFQDPDEAAHLEFICRRAGAPVIYTAEIFENDDTFASTLVKHLRRMMAADFSRDLSEKVRRARVLLHAGGYYAGGPPAYGLVRRQVAPDGRPMGVMVHGERKSFPGCRTVLVPGPPEETAVVRRIFQAFVSRQRTTAQIAAELNARGETFRRGRSWKAADVRSVLRNEAHAGVLVAGKQRYHLNRRRGNVPSGQWRRKPRAIPAVVSRAVWAKAATLLDQGRRRYVSDEVLLADLRALHRQHGRLSAELIDAGGGYVASLYKVRFGSLTEAYIRAGFGQSESERRAKLRAPRPVESYLRKPNMDPDEEMVTKLERVLLREGRLTNRIINAAPDCPCVPAYSQRFGGLRRAYALAGYQPSRYQDLQLEAHGQSISSEAARQICAAAMAARALRER